MPTTKRTSLSFVLLLLYPTLTNAAHLHPEAWYQERWCEAHGGQTGVTMPDGTQCDCLTDTHAIVFNFGEKWAKSIGQSVSHGLQTGKQPGVVLILEKESDKEHRLRLNATIERYKLPIDTWETNGEDVLSELQSTDDTYHQKTPQPDSLDKVSVFDRLRKGFSMHKENYFLPLTWGNRNDGTKDAELKFQFSFKQQIWKGFYFAYTQKSFWRVLDENDSRPFRETNYNPEFFFRFERKLESLKWSGDIGLFEHESNGAREPTSRSWNRIYIAPSLSYKGLEARLKLWYRLEEEVKANPYDTSGDENPDIEDFYGYGELNLSYTFTTDLSTDPWKVSLMTRHNFATDKGGLQLDFSTPTPIKDFYILGQLWTGYGETLIDYNKSLTRYGIGCLFRY